MKQLLFAVAFTTQVITTVFAQPDPSAQLIVNTDRKSIGRSEIKINAIRNFKKQFTKADETWSTKEDGFRARFIQDDIRYMVDYDQKGNWVSTIRVYDENDLSADIRKTVKSIYIDYSIVKVIEVKIGKVLVHFIKMDNQFSLLTLHIMNGEINEIENYKKG
jgi:hypothetical protein